MTQQASQGDPAETGPRPIVPYLRLPDENGGDAYLVGKKCPECGTIYLDSRIGCAKCSFVGDLPEVRLGTEGSLHTWTIVHMSRPGVPVPFVAGIVDMKDGISVPANIEGVEPDPAKLKFGMPLRLVTDTAFTDAQGRDVIRYAFRPAG
ncbi:MAG: OB-fold domain-containing protein [Chloroflexi bacterium]|nr:OB-fold domain-containing protein [Chloroflexota bacterium]